MRMSGKRKRRRRWGAWRHRTVGWVAIAGVCVLAHQNQQVLSQVQTATQQLLFGQNTAEQTVLAFGQMASEVVLDFPQTIHVSGELVAESGNFGDFDALRVQSLFPDTVDNTIYELTFACTSPVEGTLSSSFGERISPTSGEPSFHYGMDIAAEQGTPILCIADGMVTQVGESSYGNYIVVTHDNGTASMYAHCDVILAEQGAVVQAGQEIAQVGSTGNSTGNHLHIELWRAGMVLDPSLYLYL